MKSKDTNHGFELAVAYLPANEPVIGNEMIKWGTNSNL